MSAKGRGPALGGDLEVYPTPAWAVHRLLERADFLQPGLWLEPCAGYGAIIRAVAADERFLGTVTWAAVEIRPEVEGLLHESFRLARAPGPAVIADFLRMDHEAVAAELRGCKVVLTNPPFSLAEQFLFRCAQVAPDAHVCFLLRSNFIGSERRAEWMRDHMPDSYQLPQRPSFRDDDDAGGTDSAEYTWLVWEPGALESIRRRGHVELLGPTPRDVRRRDREEAKALLAGVEFLAPQLDLLERAAVAGEAA